MKRYFRKLLYTFIILSLMVSLAPSALATGTLVTNDWVNFRTDASLDAEIITTLSPGSSVEVLEHDPAGWSKVRVNGTIGYMNSEFLTISASAESVTFRTTGGVNFRTEPSLDADVMSTIATDTRVEVLEHNPAGWSKVRANGTVGYIKSEFLALPIQSAQPAAAPPSPPAAASTPPPTAASTATPPASTTPETLKTIHGVNVRSGPSPEAGIIKTLEANTSVTVIERDPDGWTKVTAGETVGYIRSDLISVSGRNVELLHWSEVRNMIKRNVPIHVIDVRTGRSYTIKCFSIYDHADVEPATQADTDIFYDIRDGVRSWASRPVWVSIDDRLIAAALHGMPHDVTWIPDNGMDGHLCLHFLGSTTSSTSVSYRTDLQNSVQEAWNAR